MKYLMAPIWLASFLEKARVPRTRRETRCRNVLLKQRAGKRLKSIQVPAFQCCEQEHSFFFERAVRMTLRRWVMF